MTAAPPPIGELSKNAKYRGLFGSLWAKSVCLHYSLVTMFYPIHFILHPESVIECQLCIVYCTEVGLAYSMSIFPPTDFGKLIAAAGTPSYGSYSKTNLLTYTTTWLCRDCSDGAKSLYYLEHLISLPSDDWCVRDIVDRWRHVRRQNVSRITNASQLGSSTD